MKHKTAVLGRSVKTVDVFENRYLVGREGFVTAVAGSRPLLFINICGGNPPTSGFHLRPAFAGLRRTGKRPLVFVSTSSRLKMGREGFEPPTSGLKARPCGAGLPTDLPAGRQG